MSGEQMNGTALRSGASVVNGPPTFGTPLQERSSKRARPSDSAADEPPPKKQRQDVIEVGDDDRASGPILILDD